VHVSITATASRPARLIARLASALTAPPPGAEPPPAGRFHHRHEDALAVLTATRGVIARGWVQNTWYVLETPAGPHSIRQHFFPSRLDHQRVVQACLVGAVMHGAWLLSPRPEYAYPAIDALWRTLFDATAPGNDDPVGPMAPPLERTARVRDLTTWNDRRYRAQHEVLQLVDVTAARVSARRPAPRPADQPAVRPPSWE
jgi:hypothetical protein